MTIFPKALIFSHPINFDTEEDDNRLTFISFCITTAVPNSYFEEQTKTHSKNEGKKKGSRIKSYQFRIDLEYDDASGCRSSTAVSFQNADKCYICPTNMEQQTIKPWNDGTKLWVSWIEEFPIKVSDEQLIRFSEYLTNNGICVDVCEKLNLDRKLFTDHDLSVDKESTDTAIRNNVELCLTEILNNPRKHSNQYSSSSFSTEDKLSNEHANLLKINGMFHL